MKNPLPHKKLIFIVLLTIVFIEIIWVGVVIFFPPQPSYLKNQKTTNKPAGANQQKLDGQFTLAPAKQNVKVSSKFTLNILVDSNNHPVDGVDVSLKYDPKFLEVQASSSAKAIIPGTLLDSYPPQKIDKAKGEISFSAIGKPNKNKSLTGTLGQITFKALKTGNTQVGIDFTPYATTDSNISESGTAVDILGKVVNSQITITSP